MELSAENMKYPIDTTVEAADKNKLEVSISELFAVLVSKFWLLILAGLVAAVGAYFYTSEFIVPTYKSTARVYILNRQSSLSTSINDLNSAETLKDDFKLLIKSNEVCRQVLKYVGEDPSGYKPLLGQVSLDNNSTRFVDISVTDKDPVRAKLLVDAFAKVSRKKAIEIMGVEDITIEELGEIPTSPSSPNMSGNIRMAAIIGVVLAAGIILLFHILNDTIQTEEDVEKALGISVLGSIPDISMLRRHKSNKKVTKNEKAKK